MTDGDAWFEGTDPGDPAAAADRIREGRADAPADWPTAAVDRGWVHDREAYYDALKAATTAATRAGVEAAERADDRQLAHAVRAMDDAERVANELAERVDEWAGSLGLGGGSPMERTRAIAGDADDGDGDPDPVERRVRALADRVVALERERDDLRAYVERTAPAVAPNLAALAGPTLAARLVALAGDLESLAKKPSGTVQLLGAEDALFAHLRGDAPSPKHGIIYTHEYVRGTHPDHRGSAARALAGKLAIAARVDHYAGDRRPELERELDERIATIRARTDGGSGEPGNEAGRSDGGGGDDGA
jgi:nucleolar protein 56